MDLATKRKIPTLITISRILAVPFVVALMAPDSPLYNMLAALLFVAASATDYFDGALARKWGVVSNLGKFMDPVADKVLVTSVMVMLVAQVKIDPYLVMILLSRDLVIGGLRSVAASDQVIIDAKPAGKWKAALQMLAIPAILIQEPMIGSYGVHHLGYAILWISVFLSLTSAWDYIQAYRQNPAKKG